MALVIDCALVWIGGVAVAVAGCSYIDCTAVYIGQGGGANFWAVFGGGFWRKTTGVQGRFFGLFWTFLLKVLDMLCIMTYNKGSSTDGRTDRPPQGIDKRGADGQQADKMTGGVHYKRV